jgi:ABC-2 type transport system permease protein
MIQQLLSICRNTFLESIRQPIFVVLLIAGLVNLWVNPSLSGFTLGDTDDNRLLMQLGLSCIFFWWGPWLTAFTATRVLCNELENRTVLTVVSKPVPRPLFVLGKYLGVVGALAVAHWIMVVVLVLTIRHKVMSAKSDPYDWPVIVFGVGAGLVALLVAAGGNYLYRWVFTSSLVAAKTVCYSIALLLVLLIGKGWHFQSIATEFRGEGALAHGQLVWAFLISFQAILILAAVAIAASTRLGQVMTVAVTVGAWVVGGAVTGQFLKAQSHSWLAWVLGRVLPNLQFLWKADAMIQGQIITASQVLLLCGYSALMVGALLCLAIALFQTREVG